MNDDFDIHIDLKDAVRGFRLAMLEDAAGRKGHEQAGSEAAENHVQLLSVPNSIKTLPEKADTVEQETGYEVR